MLAPIQFVAFLVGVAVTYFYYRDSGIFPFYWVGAAFLFKTFMFALMFYTGAYFEKELFELYPKIGVIKDTLYQIGAVYSAMSGSGSTVFGLFESKPDYASVFNGYYTFYQKL